MTNNAIAMNEKTCLITGSTSGIGREAALRLASMGATVVLTGRDSDKCKDAAAYIGQKSGSGSVSYLVADLSSQASVRQLAGEFSDSHQKLDVLVNNAGVFLMNRQLTTDGIEHTLAVNHLAPFLLTNLLMDRLRAAAPSRIITTSSVAHKGAGMDLSDIQFEKRKYGGIRAYSQSKLANVLFTYELARRLEGTGITANCFHPGVVRTGLGSGNSRMYQMILAIMKAVFHKP